MSNKRHLDINSCLFPMNLYRLFSVVTSLVCSRRYYDALKACISSPRTEPPAFTDAGEPAAFFSDEEVALTLTPFQHAVVALYMCIWKAGDPRGENCHPTAMWNSRGFHHHLGPKHLLFRFFSESSFLKVLLKDLIYIKGLLFRFFKWTPAA